jgi:hypothetical protein
MMTSHTTAKKTVSERTTLPLPKSEHPFGGWGPRLSY